MTSSSRSCKACDYAHSHGTRSPWRTGTTSTAAHNRELGRIGDVAAPPLVDLGGVSGEVPADRIGPGRGRGVGDGGLLPPLGRAAAQAVLAHQPGDALAGVPVPFAAQLGMDPRGAVPAPGSLVLSLDLDDELGVVAVPVTGLPAAGGVAGGTGDLQQLGTPA